LTQSEIPQPVLIPIQDEQGNVIKDAGKRVTVNSVGGALINVNGVVTDGPYRFHQNYHKKKLVFGRPTYKEYFLDSVPYWKVKLDDYNLEIHFTEKELK